MIQKNTLLDVADNSGGRKAICIGLLNNKTSATVGDVIVVSIKAINSKSKISRGKVCKAVVVRVKTPVRRLDGSVMRFSSNAVVLIGENSEPLGTRVFGVIRKMPHGLFPKIMSLAVEVL